ncbi:protein of unknown function [Chitinophaga costaii]|uniref:DUF4290 domain-containing protein n=1 Tax=Chitinophaga costaii TaxID=1335309 RepID=A0A1C4FPW1_9BACT|nr:DUF4290 domain-containing protein [Chitinophaga costaii]PUZ20447.1 DUF4290 domain-containing protein [Chitinophaga costaii]SCC58000.1 protein of unknown function [Chitinophaga costaii]
MEFNNIEGTYNTDRNHLIMKEYGRNVQKMVEFLLTIEDPEDRQRNAMIVIELMGTLNPHLRNVEDFRHKLWDHLFLISDFKLKVESPYPIPTREKLRARPEPMPYPKQYPKFRHLGKNIEQIIERAVKEENPEKKEGFVQCIGNYMKLAYTNWHKESIHDDAIKGELLALTRGELEYQPGYVPPAAPASNPGPGNNANFGNSEAGFLRANGNGGPSKRNKNFQPKFKNNGNGKSNNKQNKYKNRNK